MVHISLIFFACRSMPGTNMPTPRQHILLFAISFIYLWSDDLQSPTGWRENPRSFKSLNTKLELARNSQMYLDGRWRILLCPPVARGFSIHDICGLVGQVADDVKKCLGIKPALQAMQSELQLGLVFTLSCMGILCNGALKHPETIWNYLKLLTSAAC